MSVRRLADEAIQPKDFAFSAENLKWAEKKIAEYPAGRQQSAVIPLLMRVQDQDGWISRPAIEHIADRLGMAYIRVLEVATFYTQFQLHPVGTKAHIQVCGTTPCMLRGAEDIRAVCERRIHAEPHHTNADGTLDCVKVKDPSIHNWFGLALALRGTPISDFPICNKSFSLSYAGHDL